MTTKFHSLGDEGFRSLFSDFQYSAYRLETLQQYDVTYERDEYKRFLDGEPQGEPSGISGWVDRVQKGTLAGKRFQRVHIVEEPLSDYIRFESAWSYRHTVAAGEDVRIIAVTKDEWPSDLPTTDYWLFDSTRLLVMNYAPDGAFVSATLMDEPEQIAQANLWRDRAVFLSIPFSHYAANFDDLMQRK